MPITAYARIRRHGRLPIGAGRRIEDEPMSRPSLRFSPDALARIQRARERLDALELMVRLDRRRRGLPETDPVHQADSLSEMAKPSWPQ
jgi:hypothetical protein